ncbi:hypothetical protein JTB14_022079 [Gonioctena quinquepunctata]|nr:hypothetical protein JTB14_022079 [Gonioctena quinquepunctata]
MTSPKTMFCYLPNSTMILISVLKDRYLMNQMNMRLGELAKKYSEQSWSQIVFDIKFYHLGDTSADTWIVNRFTSWWQKKQHNSIYSYTEERSSLMLHQWRSNIFPAFMQAWAV